jgi:hypothetical protein
VSDGRLLTRCRWLERRKLSLAKKPKAGSAQRQSSWRTEMIAGGGDEGEKERKRGDVDDRASSKWPPMRTAGTTSGPVERRIHRETYLDKIRGGLALRRSKREGEVRKQPEAKRK